MPDVAGKSHRLLALAAAAAFTAAAAILYRYPPTDQSFYPRCMFNYFTGLHCPGCGATRCLHALSHGDVQQAAAYNVVFLVVLPFLLIWLARIWYSAVTGRTLHRIRFPTWSIHVFLIIIMGFWVLRNLPFWPFNLLAPHTLTSL